MFCVTEHVLFTTLNSLDIHNLLGTTDGVGEHWRKNNDEGLGANHKFKKKREKLVSEDNQ